MSIARIADRDRDRARRQALRGSLRAPSRRQARDCDFGQTILRAVADTGTLWLLATIRSFSASVQPRRESVEITSSCDTDELGVFGSHRI